MMRSLRETNASPEIIRIAAHVLVDQALGLPVPTEAQARSPEVTGPNPDETFALPFEGVARWVKNIVARRHAEIDEAVAKEE